MNPAPMNTVHVKPESHSVISRNSLVSSRTGKAAARSARLLPLLMFCTVWLSAGLNLQGAGTPPQADGAGAFATGRYRNLFAEIGKPPAEIRKKVDSAFQQLFHGNVTNETVYYEARTN